MASEITAPILLCGPDGSLNPAAVGWSRRPLHLCNLRGHRLRKKRWDFWAVASADVYLTVTVADIDYAGVAALAFLDLATGRWTERFGVAPLGRGFDLPETVGGASTAVTAGGVTIAIDEEGGATRLRGRAAGLEIDVTVERPAARESVNVLVPFGPSRFHFTSKQPGLPAHGHATVEGRHVTLASDAWACLDFGRGALPYVTSWFWAAGAGPGLGLNLGGRWTDGTGVTESGVIVDGQLHKIGTPLQFTRPRDPGGIWRIAAVGAGAGGALEFEPVRARTLRAPLVVVGGRLDWAFGRFRGALRADDGTRIAVDDVLGWAEEAWLRW
jgi:hypothetical protein